MALEFKIPLHPGQATCDSQGFPGEDYGENKKKEKLCCLFEISLHRGQPQDWERQGNPTNFMAPEQPGVGKKGSEDFPGTWREMWRGESKSWQQYNALGREPGKARGYTINVQIKAHLLKGSSLLPPSTLTSKAGLKRWAQNKLPGTSEMLGVARITIWRPSWLHRPPILLQACRLVKLGHHSRLSHLLVLSS